MTLITDSSFLVALYNGSDIYHLQAYDFAENLAEPIVVPDVVLPEVSYLLRRNLGYADSLKFLDFFDYRNVTLGPVLRQDLVRVFEISQQYLDARLDLVDCCIVAIAERLDITRIATFDRRDFSLVRPRHGEFLELLP